TIANGVDLKRFPGRTRKGDYALFLGRICPEKGVHLALEAAERANVRIILAGTVFPYPEHQKYFCDVIRPRLGEKVHLIGAVGGARKAQLLGGAKCLLVPSLAEETSCLAAMEAFAARTPVIAWPSGALPEIVTHGRTGFLVSSVEEMAEGIAGVHAISGDRCRSEAERRFSSKAMISAYMSLYRRLVAARAPSLRAA
ncbi:MAG: glycosyltransferase, partial [Acidobacteria bacterium]|nr:glycosyltransferase [Acidobacteriota bacterium]